MLCCGGRGSGVQLYPARCPLRHGVSFILCWLLLAWVYRPAFASVSLAHSCVECGRGPSAMPCCVLPLWRCSNSSVCWASSASKLTDKLVLATFAWPSPVSFRPCLIFESPLLRTAGHCGASAASVTCTVSPAVRSRPVCCGCGWLRTTPRLSYQLLDCVAVDADC